LPTYPPEPWKDFLLELDARMPEPCMLTFFGGFLATLHRWSCRLTALGPSKTAVVCIEEPPSGRDEFGVEN